MTVIEYNLFDLLIFSLELIGCVILYAIIKGWIENRRWEKHIYKVVEEYRAKYGVDDGCELLMYKKANGLDGDGEI